MRVRSASRGVRWILRVRCEWHDWGLSVGHWHVTWWDLWKDRPCLEIGRDEDPDPW